MSIPVVHNDFLSPNKFAEQAVNAVRLISTVTCTRYYLKDLDQPSMTFLSELKVPVAGL
jgi:hypothetical protein